MSEITQENTASNISNDLRDIHQKLSDNISFLVKINEQIFDASNFHDKPDCRFQVTIYSKRKETSQILETLCQLVINQTLLGTK
ncbi:MAG: hypothetical protein ACD_19C00061G0002, partial [uncultured bacterium]